MDNTDAPVTGVVTDTGMDTSAAPPRTTSLRLASWLFLRPAAFFRSWGADAPLGWLIAATWLVGIGSMSSSILNRIRDNQLPTWLPLDLDNWTAFWAVLLLAGILRGLGITLIGGGWFRARLWLSGVRTPCWSTSLRLYMGGRFVEQLVVVLATAAGPFFYPSPSRYLDDGVGRAVMITGLTLLLWGGVVPFLGARALFRLNRWSWLWLLGLPLAWRLAIVAVGLWLIASGGPRFKNYGWNEPGTRTHAGPVFSVAIDQSWIATDREDGVDAARPDGRVSWGATIVAADEADEAALALGGTDSPIKSPGPGTIGRWTGTRWQHQVGDDKVVVLDSELDANHRVLFRLAAPQSEWQDVYADLQRCMASAMVVDPRIVTVNASQMATIESELVAFEVPQSWIIESKNTENDTLGPLEQITVRSPGAAEIFVLSYHSDQPADQLFEATRTQMADWYTLDRVRPLTRWRDFACVGMDAVGRTSRGMPIELRIVVLELPNDARVEIMTIIAPHEPHALRQGVRHFEQSVRLKASEP